MERGRSAISNLIPQSFKADMEIMDAKDEVFNLDSMQDDFKMNGDGDRPHVFRSSLSGTLPKF
jgi:hypothetical protein